MFKKPSINFHLKSVVRSPAGTYEGLLEDVRSPVAYDIESHQPSEFSESSLAKSLPVLATASDAREIVRYLKQKPNGVSVIEAMGAQPRRIFDGRKIAAYEFWGIIDRRNERLALSELGWGLAETVETECRSYRHILRSVPVYQGAIEFIHRNKLKTVSRADVSDYWERTHPEVDLDESDEKSLEAISVTFFSLCHAAELGTLTIGKRGQPARLDVDGDQVNEFMAFDDIANVVPIGRQFRKNAAALKKDHRTEIKRIYFSSRGLGSVSDNFRAILELAGFEDTAFDDASANNSLLQPDELNILEQCQAAVFVIDRNDCVQIENAELELSASRLARMNAARALFRHRIIVLWNDPETALPASLRQVDAHEFSCNDLGWADGLRLIGLLKDLRT